MPSFGSGEATAVARTALSPLVVKRGAGGLLGQPAGLKFDLLAASKLYSYVVLHDLPLFLF